MPDWVGGVSILDTALIGRPIDLAITSRLDALEIPDTLQQKDEMALHWQACKFFCETTQSIDKRPLRARIDSTDKAAQMIEGRTIDEKDIHISYMETLHARDLPPDFDKLTPQIGP